jgi:hypothetical protein
VGGADPRASLALAPRGYASAFEGVDGR